MMSNTDQSGVICDDASDLASHECEFRVPRTRNRPGADSVEHERGGAGCEREPR